MSLKSDETPLVSVLMSVYNGERYLRKAIQSILNQSLENFEFIIINDGSTDNTAEILRSYQDTRMKVSYQKNRGLSISLNRGIKLCRGKYIARMDADDISLPDRLNLQVDMLERNSEYVMVGTSVYVIDENDKILYKISHPADDLGIKWLCLFNSPFAHSSVMIRKDAIVRANYYKEEAGYFTEDYDLWSKIVYDGKVANLKDFVHKYRDNSQGISNTNIETQKRQALQISINNICDLINNSSFGFEQAFVLRCLWDGTFEKRGFNSEQIMRVDEDAKRIKRELIHKYGGENTDNKKINKDMQKIKLRSIYYLGKFRSEKGARKLIMQSLVEEFSCLDQWTYWKAAYVLLFGWGAHNRIRSLLSLLKNTSRRLRGK